MESHSPVRSKAERFFAPEASGDQAVASLTKMGVAGIAAFALLSRYRNGTFERTAFCLGTGLGATYLGNELGFRWANELRIARLQSRLDQAARPQEEAKPVVKDDTDEPAQPDAPVTAAPSTSPAVAQPTIPAEPVNPRPEWAEMTVGVAIGVVSLHNQATCHSGREEREFAVRNFAKILKEWGRKEKIEFHFRHWDERTMNNRKLHAQCNVGILLFCGTSHNRQDKDQFNVNVWADEGSPILNPMRCWGVRDDRKCRDAVTLPITLAGYFYKADEFTSGQAPIWGHDYRPNLRALGSQELFQRGEEPFFDCQCWSGMLDEDGQRALSTHSEMERLIATIKRGVQEATIKQLTDRSLISS